MGKPPDIIEGEFTVASGLPEQRQPFWGRNAGISNALYALTLGFGCIGLKPQTGKTPLRTKIVYFLLIAAIVLGRLWTSS